MANVAAGAIGAYNHALVANVVDTVTFPQDVEAVEVVSNGTARIYVRTDGVTPTMGDGDAYEIPAAAGLLSRTIPIHNRGEARSGPVVVKLISDGTPTYSVSKEEAPR